MAVQDHGAPGPHRPHTEGVSPAGENHQQMETPELLRRWRRDGDAAAREAVVERFLPLARQLARRYQRANEPFDDLVQVASMGLVKAVDRFDTERGVAFSSYAVPTVLGELKRYFRDVGWAAHVPRGMQERVMRVEQASRTLRGRDGRSPSVAQVAESAGLELEEVLEAMQASHAYEAVSLEGGRESDSEGSDSYAERLGEEDERFELIEYGAVISSTLKALSPRDRLVMHLRFVEDMTQSEIAERIGVSQMQVSRLIRRALERLRAVADAS